MSFISQNLNLPYIAPAQAQKHVTHNEALRALDAIVHLSLVSKSQTTPPASPSEGARYFVTAVGTDEWAEQDGQIAAYQDGAWAFYAPATGWQAWIQDESALQIWDGTAWQIVAPVPNYQNLEHIGINTTADTTNRLAVSSPATLFNHAGNGHQLKLNKNTITDTASLLYQTNWSGRAEMGLTGDDSFHIKVSADGNAWNDALTIDKSTTHLTLPGGFLDIKKDTPELRITCTRTGSNTQGDVFGQLVFYSLDPNHRKLPGPHARIYALHTRLGNHTYADTGLGFDILSSTGTLERVMVIDSDTRSVAIGSKITPEAKLDVDGAIKVKSYTVSSLPTNTAGGIAFVSNETGGAVLAFSDGTNWRRVTDRAVVS